MSKQKETKEESKTVEDTKGKFLKITIEEDKANIEAEADLRYAALGLATVLVNNPGLADSFEAALEIFKGQSEKEE